MPSVAEQNPYGVAYPTANIGVVARAASKPGAKMKNLKFRGYRVREQGMIITPGSIEPITLADYFDPELRNKSASGAPYRVLHITVVRMWCTPCNDEAREVVGLVGELDREGALFLSALAEGAVQGGPASWPDLDNWVVKHKANFTHVLDPGLQSFGGYFDGAVGAYNADVDLRSMEILYSGTGKPADVRAHVRKWLAWTAENPAQSLD